MALKESWHERQLDTIRELLQEGAGLIEESEFGDAEERLKEAVIITECAEDETPDILNLRSTAYNELGILATHSRDPEAAIKSHKSSLKARQALQLKVDNDLSQVIAAAHLNLGTVLAATRSTEDAKIELTTALDLMQKYAEDNTTESVSLFFGIYQNLGIVLASGNEMEEALEHLLKAVALGKQLVQDGQDEFRENLSQVIMNLSVAYNTDGKNALAIDSGIEASELARILYEEAPSQSRLHQFLNCQLNLMSFNEEVNKFDAAEDALFKILEVVPKQPQVLQRGITFFKKVLELSDQEITDGGLSRDEAHESLSELEAALE